MGAWREVVRVTVGIIIRHIIHIIMHPLALAALHCDRLGCEPRVAVALCAASNALSLVAREPDAMKFIKYVSAAAPGSRWDVAAEYTCSG